MKQLSDFHIDKCYKDVTENHTRFTVTAPVIAVFHFFKLYFRRPQRHLRLMSTLITDSLSCEHEKYSGLVRTPVYTAMKSSKETYPIENFKIGAAQPCSVTETVPKLPFLCAINSKARYDIVFIPAQEPSSIVNA